MEAYLQKWGNSLGLRIPMNLLKQLDLKDGSKVDISLCGEDLIIHPKKKYTLSGLLAQITSENCHGEKFSSYIPVGNEVW